MSTALERISGLHIADHEHVKISGSAGYTIGHGSHEEELRALVRIADDALYSAKEQGKIRFVRDNISGRRNRNDK